MQVKLYVYCMLWWCLWYLYVSVARFSWNNPEFILGFFFGWSFFGAICIPDLCVIVERCSRMRDMNVWVLIVRLFGVFVRFCSNFLFSPPFPLFLFPSFVRMKSVNVLLLLVAITVSLLQGKIARWYLFLLLCCILLLCALSWLSYYAHV